MDELSSPLGKVCQGISVGLIAVDLFANVYNSYQKDYSFVQGVVSFRLTAAKDIGAYFASSAVASAVGSYFVGSKAGAALGSLGGPVGVVVGAVAGFAVGCVINVLGDIIIEWTVGLFD